MTKTLAFFRICTYSGLVPLVHVVKKAGVATTFGQLGESRVKVNFGYFLR